MAYSTFKSFRLLLVTMVCAGLLIGCGDSDKTAEKPAAPAQESNAAIPAAPVNPQIVQTLKPARMVVRPSNLRLGPLLPGNTDTKAITITNEGEEILTVREITFNGDPSELSIGGSCLTNLPKPLAGKESCQIEVMFTPIQAGGQVNGEVVITPEGDNPPAFVPVTAVKADPPPPPAAPPPVVYQPSPALENAISMYQQRRGGRMVVLASEPETGAGDLITKDQDYTPLGFAPTISTLPVDRSRLVTADKYIPAVLENTINSQLAGGRIVGVVENHVYGGDGRFILIPAGSRAIGVYESLNRQGDTRLKASFVRVMRPDGAAIAIEGDPAADAMGRLGLIGDVDNRYFDRFAGPLLISLINAIGTYATSPDTIISSDNVGNTTTTQTLSPEQQAYQNFANDLSFVSQRLVEENLNLAPIITIPGGTRFYIMPTRDILLQGYSFVAAPSTNPASGEKQVAGLGSNPAPAPVQPNAPGTQNSRSLPKETTVPPTPSRSAKPGYAR